MMQNPDEVKSPVHESCMYEYSSMHGFVFAQNPIFIINYSCVIMEEVFGIYSLLLFYSDRQILGGRFVFYLTHLLQCQYGCFK